MIQKKSEKNLGLKEKIIFHYHPDGIVVEIVKNENKENTQRKKNDL